MHELKLKMCAEAWQLRRRFQTTPPSKGLLQKAPGPKKDKKPPRQGRILFLLIKLRHVFQNAP